MMTARLRAVRSVCVVAIMLCVATFTLAADPGSVLDRRQLLTASAEPPAFAPAYIRPVEPIRTEAPKRVVDKKFIAMSALAMGFTIADIERTQHCLGNHTCQELNPTLPTSRAGMYAVNIPVNAGLMYLSYRLKASGRKSWWIAPIAIAGAHVVGFGFRF